MNLSTRQWLAIDGVGALVSALLLGIVLPYWEGIFGMPRHVCYFLAGWPVLFALFDGYAYSQQHRSYAGLLRIIAYANLTYCVLSVMMLFTHYDQLTTLGGLYFIGEVLLVSVMALMELRVAAQDKTA